jgi:hypothetical protein
MNWLDLVQIALLLASCLACYFRGIETGIERTFDFVVRENIVDEKTLDRKLKQISARDS